jgi:outer membrane biosynthesis protein TonB
LGTHVQPAGAGQKERWGRFVLLAETESGPWGTEYRAAQIGAAGFERLVSLVRFPPGFPASAVNLMAAQARAAMKVGGAGVLALVDGDGDEGWLAHEYVAGRSLGTVLAKGREEGMPFALDNALQVGRQVGIALERTHAQKGADGVPLIHGLLTPWSVIVSYEGAVQVRGFGLWASRTFEGRLADDEAGVLAPEQVEGHADGRSDVYGLATLMLTCLGGGPAARGADLLQQLANLRQIDDEPLPEGLLRALERALSPRAADRQSTVSELRREIEMVLFSNDLATTTFNLAFFMQTLFRQTVDDEAKAASREGQAAYYTPEAAAETVAAAPVPAAEQALAAAEIVSTPPAADTESIVAEAVGAPAPAHHEPVTQRRAVHARRDAAGPGRALVIGGAVLVLALAVGGFLVVKGRRDAARAAAAPATLSPEAQAALARVQELEARLQTLEDERLRAEAAAAQAEKDRLEAEAKAKGRKVDPQALARAQEEAARKARLEQEKQQREELARLEKQKREQEAQLAAATPVTLPPAPPPTAAAAPATLPAAIVPTPAAADPAAAPTPAPVAAAANEPPPTTLAAAAPAPPASGVYELDAPGLVPPSVVKEAPPEYPLIARTGRITGGVMVTAVVDEQGRVTQARALSGNAVLRKPAVDQVNSRIYRPARKDGVAVKVRITVLVTFKG